MMRLRNYLIKLHAVALLFIFLYLLFLFLASGHRINFEDFTQLKLLFEIFIFFSAGVTLFFGKRNNYFRNTLIIILLILVQISFVDFYLEISDVEYGGEKPVISFMLLFIFFASNLFLIYSQIKLKTMPDSKSVV